MTPLVSVLMPARDAAQWIEAAITSVLVQSHKTLEVVVVDDGSTDRTTEVVESFGDARVKLVRSPPLGIGPASNLGLAHCTGEYVARLDADDYMLGGRLAKQVAWLEAHPDIALIGGRGLVVHTDGRRSDGPTPLFRGRALHWALHAWCVLLHGAAMWRRAAIPDGYPLVSRFCCDWSMFLRLQHHARVEMFDEPMIIYRRHAGAIGKALRREQDDANRDVLSDYLARYLGIDAEPSSVLAWVRPEHAYAVTDPADVANLALALHPDRLELGAHVPPWQPGERERCRREHLLRVLRIARRSKQPRVWRALAPLIARGVGTLK